MNEPLSPDSPRRPVIMVVDDAQTMLRAAKNFLEPDYEVITAADGFAALAALQDVRPDLVLMDVSMPRLDGYSSCMAIKQNPEFKSIPIVMMTGKDSPFDKAHGEQMGCDDYLTKPFTEESLREKIRKHLRWG